jgi:ketosteroid isomerase-like protein
MRRFVLAVFALTVLAACQPTTTELTEEQKAEIADTVRQVYADFLSAGDPVDFERMMTFAHPDVEQYYVGEPAQWVNLLTVYPDNDRVREVWEPIMAGRRSQETVINDEYVAVLAENMAVHVVEGTYAITDTLGNTTEPNRLTASTVWIREGEEWKMIHMHQSWIPQN